MQAPGPQRPLNAQFRGSGSRLPTRTQHQRKSHVSPRMPDVPTADTRGDSGGKRSGSRGFNTPTPKSSSDTLVDSVIDSPKDSACGDRRQSALKSKVTIPRCEVRTVALPSRIQLPISSIISVPKKTPALLLTPDSKPPAARRNSLVSLEQDRSIPTLASANSNRIPGVLQRCFAVAAQEKGGLSTVANDPIPTSCPADRSHDRAQHSFQPYPVKSAGTSSKQHGSQLPPLKTTTSKKRDAPIVDTKKPRKDLEKGGLPCWHHYHYIHTQSPRDFIPLEGCHAYDHVSQIPRHSCAHKAYICVKCVRSFPNKEALNGHDHVPACNDSSCKRHQEAGSRRGRPDTCPNDRPCLKDSVSCWWAVYNELFYSGAGGSHGHQTMPPNNSLPAGPTNGPFMVNNVPSQPLAFGAENGRNSQTWLHATNLSDLDATWLQNNPNTGGAYTIQLPQDNMVQPYDAQQAMPNAPTPSSGSNTNFSYAAPSNAPAFRGVDYSQTANTSLQQGGAFFPDNYISFAGPPVAIAAYHNFDSDVAATGQANQAGPTMNPGFDGAMPNGTDFHLSPRTADPPVNAEDNSSGVHTGSTSTLAVPQPVPENVAGPEQDDLPPLFDQLITRLAFLPNIPSRDHITRLIGVAKDLYEQDMENSPPTRYEKSEKHDSGVGL